MAKLPGCTCRDERAVAAEVGQAVEAATRLLWGRFRRARARRHAADYLRGLAADVERKNGWQPAERVGYRHPRGMQRVLDRYTRDADLVRDDLRAYVVAALGDARGVLVVDETGFPKQGSHSVGVARRYCDTLGKRANCQVGVFLGYASPKGHAGLDRALYLPREWAEDEERRRAVGVPDGVAFQTKPQLASALVQRALDAGVPAAWVAGDEVYGGDRKFPAPLEDRGQGDVLAVRRNRPLSTWPPLRGAESVDRGRLRQDHPRRCLAAVELRGRGARAPHLRLGVPASPTGHAQSDDGWTALGARPAGSPPPRPPRRPRLLPRVRPGGGAAGGAGARGRGALDHRRGSQPAGLVPA